MESQTWHAVSSDEVLNELGSSASGLSTEDASARLARYGPNSLRPPKPASAVDILVAQLKSVIVVLLVGAVAISLAFGDRIEAAAIAAVLVINTMIGFVTELRARRAMEALLRLDVPRASVIRGGELRVIDAHELVPGDVIELETGRQVPADARLITANDLRIDEAPLTGESMPVEKTPGVTVEPDTPLADRVNMVYKSTTVSAGLGRAVVTATGAGTEVGRIGTLVGKVTVERTPLERRLDELGHRLVWLALGVAALVAGLSALQGAALDLVIETAIALAVAAVPEALPAVATIALAIGVHRMARRQALVRRLPAVEALGSTTVVCTDKTRTLTSGDMSVVRIWTAGRDVAIGSTPRDESTVGDDATAAGAGFSRPEKDDKALLVPLLESAALASRDQAAAADGGAEKRGDPVDHAILVAAKSAGIDRGTLVDRSPPRALLPFSSERKLMAAFHRVDGRTVAYIKGAPGAVMRTCDRVVREGGTTALDDAARRQLLEVNERLANDGLRVLAVAAGDVSGTSEGDLRNLTFLGFIGLADPPAEGVRETIAQLRAAGLRTLMLTGDQRLTAEAIGRQLGLLEPHQRVVEGRALHEMTEASIAESIAEVGAFSRITPEHKLTIVRALQSKGEIVAMLGDGVNDAAALKAADVGVAMGIRGTDVAKAAASIVLRDDRFATVAAAVEEGRVIYDNIRKFVFYLFSCNVAEILVLLGAGLAGLPLPLLPLQLLWLNMVTDTFPALALAIEPAESDVMTRPPRPPAQAILSRAFVTRILVYGGLITASTLGAYLWALQESAAHAKTVAFMTLALAQIAHLGNARSKRAVLHPRRGLANPFALAGVAISVALQLAALQVPALSRLLHLTPLDLGDWIVIVGAAVVPAIIGQAAKIVETRSQQDRSHR